MQEADAERRMQILRGEVPTPLLAIGDKPDGDVPERRSDGFGRERKRRKKAGENDTDFEMRIAHEQTLTSNSESQIVLRKSTKDVPLLDHSGHIDLFPQEHSQKPREKNPDAEKELARKKKEYEDQYTMRLSNAAGFKQGLENPWYSKSGQVVEAVDEEVPSKDVWGNEDPRRKEREAKRIISNDPLAMMREGAAKVRQVERERKRWREEKDRELKELVEAEERRRKHKRKHEDDEDDEDNLEDFRLDRPEKVSSSRSNRGDGYDRERRRRHKERRRLEKDEVDRHRHRHRHSHSHSQRD